VIESWQPILGTNRRYEASDLGRIRSFVVNGRAGELAETPRLLKPLPHGGGKNEYLGVFITYSDGTVKKKSVHHLVLEAFVGPCPPGLQTLHRDDDKKNNRLDNLIWGTPKQNRADMHKNGIQPFRKVKVVGGAECLQCTKCGAWKPFDQYRNLSTKLASRLGKHSRCRQCGREDDRISKRARRAASAR
jgi:hypothetical protein